jgi:hypothetical protein
MKNPGNQVILNPFAQFKESNCAIPQNLVLSPQERAFIINCKNHKLKSGPKLSITESPKPTPKESPSDPDIPEEGSAQKIKTFEEKPQAPSSPLKTAITPSSDSEFAQNYQKILDVYQGVVETSDIEEFKMNEQLKWTNLEFTDKVLVSDGVQLKVLGRDTNGKFDFTSLLYLTGNKGVPKLYLGQNDLQWLLKMTNWKNVYSKLNSSEEKAYLDTFIDSLAASKAYSVLGKITIVFEIEIQVADIVFDSILSSALDSYTKLHKEFNQIRPEAILRGIENPCDNPANDLHFKNDYFYSQNPSVLQVLKLISVTLDLQEQVWCLSKVPEL